MSDNKETDKLTDRELEKVSGGGSGSPKVYYFGDVYKSSANLIYIVTDEINTSGDVHCDYYGFEPEDYNGVGSYISKAAVSRFIFKNYTFYAHIDDYIVK